MASMRVGIRSEMLRWACARADLDPASLAKRFAWLEEPNPRPTLKQAQDFADRVRVPFGDLFASKPPVETLPIADFRTKRDDLRSSPSLELLELIYANKARQDWYRDTLLRDGAEPLPFIGSVDLRTPPEEVAAAMHKRLSFERTDSLGAFRALRTAAESIGVLVMVNSSLGRERKLDVGEFRGFALVDDIAPLIFINGADAKAAHLFTLAHELAHLWLGETGLSSISTREVERGRVERWCNRVAAEFLVPSAALLPMLGDAPPELEEIRVLARRFKVSSAVMLRRLYELAVLTEQQLWSYYRAEESRWSQARTSAGGDYYRNAIFRISPPFGLAVAAAAWEGSESITEAMKLLDIKKVQTFKELSYRYGVLGDDAA